MDGVLTEHAVFYTLLGSVIPHTPFTLLIESNSSVYLYLSSSMISFTIYPRLYVKQTYFERCFLF